MTKDESRSNAWMERTSFLGDLYCVDHAHASTTRGLHTRVAAADAATGKSIDIRAIRSINRCIMQCCRCNITAVRVSYGKHVDIERIDENV